MHTLFAIDDDGLIDTDTAARRTRTDRQNKFRRAGHAHITSSGSRLQRGAPAGTSADSNHEQAGPDPEQQAEGTTPLQASPEVRHAGARSKPRTDPSTESLRYVEALCVSSRRRRAAARGEYACAERNALWVMMWVVYALKGVILSHCASWRASRRNFSRYAAGFAQ